MSIIFVDNQIDLEKNDLKNLCVEQISFPFYFENKEKIFNQFLPAFMQNEDIIYIHSSKKLNENFSIIKTVRETLLRQYPNRKFYLIDSENISIGYGLLVYEAIVYYRTGVTDEDFINYVNKLKTEISFLFTSSKDELINNYLHNENISYGSSLNLKNLYRVNGKGIIEICDNYASITQLFTKLLNIIKNSALNMCDYYIYIIFSKNNINAIKLKQLLLDTFSDDLKIKLVDISLKLPEVKINFLGLAYHSIKNKG